MAALHLVGIWALLQIAPVRQAVGEVMPILVDLVAPPAPPQPEVAPPPPPPKPVAPPPPPKPVVTVKPKLKPTPVEPVFVAPPPPPEPVVAEPEPAPPQPEVPTGPVVAAAPAAAAPAPVAAAPASPPAPKMVSISVVSYLTPPVLHYPNVSRRMQEEGRVHVRVLVDTQGLPRETRVVRSSGYPRLDESALATVRATRFKPYTEDGVAQPFWVVMPLIFELES